MNYKIVKYSLLIVSLVFYILGLTYPIIATKTKFIITLAYKEMRLWDSVVLFFDSEEYVLGAVIFFFTILFPALKYLELFNRLAGFIKTDKTVQHLFAVFDKWSMLDVFIVAIIIMNFKMDSKIIVMQIKAGTTFLALSIVLRMLASYLMSKD